MRPTICLLLPNETSQVSMPGITLIPEKYIVVADTKYLRTLIEARVWVQASHRLDILPWTGRQWSASLQKLPRYSLSA